MMKTMVLFLACLAVAYAGYYRGLGYGYPSLGYGGLGPFSGDYGYSNIGYRGLGSFYNGYGGYYPSYGYGGYYRG